MIYKIPCQKCASKGHIKEYKHVQDGICFTCDGSGFVNATKEEYKKYNECQMYKAELEKQGSYVVYNNGQREIYKTLKEIEKKYGNWYSGDIANIFYKDERIIYFKVNSVDLIEVNGMQFDKSKASIIGEYYKKITKKDIKHTEKFIEMVKCDGLPTDKPEQRLKELKKSMELWNQLTSL